MPQVRIWYRNPWSGSVWSTWSGPYYEGDCASDEDLFAQALEDVTSIRRSIVEYDFAIVIGPAPTTFTQRLEFDSNTNMLWYQGHGDATPKVKGYYAPPVPTETEQKDKQGAKMIDVSIKRDAGKLMLVVNAKDFHSELDRIGCAHQDGMYLNRPATNVAVASNRFEMSTECLLKREYPAKFDLSGLFTNIPTTAQLKSLCESAYAAGRKILDHYQPIDINIHIQKKIIK